MRHKLLEKSPRTYAVIFETGDELASGLKKFAEDEKLTGSSFHAIGAFSAVRLAWFDWETKGYMTSVDMQEQVELLSMIGDVALNEGKPTVHAHVTIARRDGTTRGGHLQAATVRPTCEVILTESPEALRKQVDPESGLPLIRV